MPSSPATASACSTWASPQERARWEERARLHGEGWRVPPWNPLGLAFGAAPLKTFQQPLRLTGTGGRAVPGAYVHCTAKTGEDDMAWSADRARERGWPVYELATGHNPLANEAERTALLDLLLKII